MSGLRVKILQGEEGPTRLTQGFLQGSIRRKHSPWVHESINYLQRCFRILVGLSLLGSCSSGPDTLQSMYWEVHGWWLVGQPLVEL